MHLPHLGPLTLTVPLPSRRCNERAGHGQMMDVETSYTEFINCDRTGRRNAVPDISGDGTPVASTSELTKDLAEMDLKAAGQQTHTSKYICSAVKGWYSEDLLHILHT